jgi:thiosulfate dehydrogenase
MHSENEKLNQDLTKTFSSLWKFIILFIAVVASAILLYLKNEESSTISLNYKEEKDSLKLTSAYLFENANISYWKAPDTDTISSEGKKVLVAYGKELIAHTAKYLGPNGSVLKMSNGMNCQNCHLDAGTRIYGNNYGSVASQYPKFRARSGEVEDIYKRVNDCFERSLNGKPLNNSGKEMQAIKAYIEFIGSNVPKGKKAEGSGFKELAYLDRAADPTKGNEVYKAKCQSCHQSNGEGIMNVDGTEYTYPPLWGSQSYNDGAGLYRISNFARYVKFNMPLGASHDNAQLTDAEAWDVAAFINSQERPHKIVDKDWPDISKKPIDHPFGPYSDNFSEIQHKYGPFQPIRDRQMEMSKKTESTQEHSAKK